MSELNNSQSEALRSYHELVTTYLNKQDQVVDRLDKKFDRIMDEVRAANTSILERVGRLESKIESNDTRVLWERLTEADKEIGNLQIEIKNLKDKPAENRAGLTTVVSVVSALITVILFLLRLSGH